MFDNGCGKMWVKLMKMLEGIIVSIPLGTHKIKRTRHLIDNRNE
jgi:hypothetical protein